MFIRDAIDTLNQVSSRVWSILQFHALLTVAGFGGWLILHGGHDAGMALVTGAFALLRFEVGGGDKPDRP
ncbi:MAG TPA: hypothetical protein VGS10_11420 [Terracidiphilus sp.]|nr:hypothetical protein [Terracidiphilus sp.]